MEPLIFAFKLATTVSDKINILFSADNAQEYLSLVDHRKKLAWAICLNDALLIQKRQ